MTKFKMGDLAIVRSTSSPIDGTVVRVVGLISDFAEVGSIYAIQMTNGDYWETGWKVICMSESCLKSPE